MESSDLNPNIWRGQQQWFHWQDIKVNYHQAGSGPDVLLLHGIYGNSWDWHSLWPLLTQQYRVTALDFVGCGDSDKPFPYDYNIHTQCELLTDLLTHLNIEDIHIVGHDYGALLALSLAQECAAINTMTLIAPRLPPSLARWPLLERLLATPIGPALIPFINEKRFMHYMQRQTGPYSRLSTQFLRDTWQLLRVHDGLRALPELLHCRYYETDWLSTLPILLIDGEYDRMAVKALPAGLSNVTHLQLSTGHFPHLEDPQNLLDLILHFLRSHSSKSITSILDDQDQSE